MSCLDFDSEEAIRLFLVAADVPKLEAENPEDNTFVSYTTRGGVREMMNRAEEFYQHMCSCPKHRFTIVSRLCKDPRLSDEEVDLVLKGYNIIRERSAGYSES